MQIADIEKQMSAPGFWDNQDSAQQFVGARKGLSAVVKPLGEAISSAEDLEAMIEMAAEDVSFASEVTGEIEKLESQLEQLQLASLLGGKHDQAGAIVTINA